MQIFATIIIILTYNCYAFIIAINVKPVIDFCIQYLEKIHQQLDFRKEFITVNELCGKIHLPSAVSHFGWDTPKVYRKLPYVGWHALSRDESLTFNCIDLFRYNVPEAPKNNEVAFMQACYRYYTNEHPSLFEVPVRYSETVENKICRDWYRKVVTEKFYRACRAEALEGSMNYHAKPWKFTKLLDESGMSPFINSGVGLLTSRIVHAREFEILCLNKYVANDVLLMPTFYAPNNRLASLELFSFGDISKRSMMYCNSEAGWYGRLGGNIVGNVKDLLTMDGCTWNKKIIPWVDDTMLKLHHSLQPNQCIEIWSNLDNLATDRDPISLIDKTNLVERVKDSLGTLTVRQVKQLEKITGQELRQCWLSMKTSEANISGYKFVSNNGRYYYIRGGQSVEYTNFIVELHNIKKEDGDFYQYGQVIMNGDSSPFKIKQRYLQQQHSLIRALTTVTLEAGLGIPTVVPNLKHYIPNVIEAFNPVNTIEKPKPVVTTNSADDQHVRVLDDI